MTTTVTVFSSHHFTSVTDQVIVLIDSFNLLLFYILYLTPSINVYDISDTTGDISDTGDTTCAKSDTGDTANDISDTGDTTGANSDTGDTANDKQKSEKKSGENNLSSKMSHQLFIM